MRCGAAGGPGHGLARAAKQRLLEKPRLKDGLEQRIEHRSMFGRIDQHAFECTAHVFSMIEPHDGKRLSGEQRALRPHPEPGLAEQPYEDHEIADELARGSGACGSHAGLSAT